MLSEEKKEGGIFTTANKVYERKGQEIIGIISGGGDTSISY